MFTGIIEDVGEITGVESSADSQNRTFWLKSSLAAEFQVDQSIAHNGVCLTVEEIHLPDSYRVTAIAETLQKTSLGAWQAGDRVNLERSLRADARLDGHFVQGHTDIVGRVTEVVDRSGSYDYSITFPVEFWGLVVPRGSIALNGISLTIAECSREAGDPSLKVSIIPYTYEQTNMHRLRPRDPVNLEFDVLGKYVAKLQALK